MLGFVICDFVMRDSVLVVCVVFLLVVCGVFRFGRLVGCGFCVAWFCGCRLLFGLD